MNCTSAQETWSISAFTPTTAQPPLLTQYSLRIVPPAKIYWDMACCYKLRALGELSIPLNASLNFVLGAQALTILVVASCQQVASGSTSVPIVQNIRLNRHKTGARCHRRNLIGSVRLQTTLLVLT